MSSYTRAQVLEAIPLAFPAGEPASVLAILDTYGVEPHERERERVQLAIVALSEGSEEKLAYFVNTAKIDYRDILYWQASGPLTPQQGEREQQAAQHILKRWGKP